MSTNDDHRADEREASSDRADLIQEQLATAITSLDATMQALVSRLDVVGDSNEEIGRWRKRATAAIVALVISMVGLTIGAAGVAWEIRQDSDRKFQVTQEDRESACRSRNTNNADNRSRFTRVFDVIETLDVEPETVRALRATLGDPATEDRDCNQDGVLSEADYAEPIQTD